MDSVKLKKLINLTEKIRKNKTAAELLAEERRQLVKELLDEFSQEGIQRTTIDGRTVCIRREVRASAGGEDVQPGEPGDMPGLIAALREAGLDDMVGETVSASTLGAWVREFDPDSNLVPSEIIAKLPEPVRIAIRVTETYDLRVTKATGGRR